MKKHIISFLFTCLTSISFSQIHEVGFFVGGTNYIGDIGRESYLVPNEIGFGLIYKYNVNPRIALRGTYTYLPISGDDLLSNNSVRNARDLNFSNTVHEFAAGLEFNFFDYNIRDPETSFTPYILAEIAAFNYKKIDEFVGTNNITYNNKFSYTIPVGIGIKGRLSDSMAYAIESGVRFTVVDDLDYTTPDIDALNFTGNGDDFYIFTGISLVYTFGRPACYAPRE